MCMNAKVSIDALLRMLDGLSIEERGVLVSLAAMCYSSKNPGRALFPLGEFGDKPSRVWEVVTGLAMRLKIAARVVVRGCEIAIDDELRWQEVEPALNTMVLVELEAVRDDVLRREKRRAVVRGCVSRFRAKNGADEVIQGKRITDPPCNTDVIQKSSITEPQSGITSAEVIRNPRITDSNEESGARASSSPTEISIPPKSPQGELSSPSSAANPQDVIPEKTGGEKTARPKLKKGARVRENTPLMTRIGSWFGRMPKTLWSVEEATALAAVSPTDDELDLLEDYYRSTSPEIFPFRRRAIITLLNNWTKDCDVARQKLGLLGSLPQASSSSSVGPSPIGDFSIF